MQEHTIFTDLLGNTNNNTQKHIILVYGDDKSKTKAHNISILGRQKHAKTHNIKETA